MDAIAVDVMSIATGKAWKEFAEPDKRQRGDC